MINNSDVNMIFLSVTFTFSDETNEGRSYKQARNYVQKMVLVHEYC